MGWFPACFGHLRRNLTTKKVQHQCSPPSNEQHECVKLLPEITKSQKEEGEIIPPIKDVMSESEVKHEDKSSTIHNEENPFFDHSNLQKEANELASSSNSDKEAVGNEDGEVEEEENDKDDVSGSNFSIYGHQETLIDEKECAAEEECCSSLFSLSIDSRRQVYGAEMGEKEVSSLMKIKNRSLENDEEKENVAVSKDPMMIQQTFEKSKPIETSLSTWLVESRTSRGSSPESENNYGDEQILQKEESDFNRWIKVEA